MKRKTFEVLGRIVHAKGLLESVESDTELLSAFDIRELLEEVRDGIDAALDLLPEEGEDEEDDDDEE